MENSWNQNHHQMTPGQNECFLKLNPAVPTNIIFQNFEMCSHRKTDLQSGLNQGAACNCQYLPDPEITAVGVNSIPDVNSQLPNNLFNQNEAMMYSSRMPFGQSFSAPNKDFSNPPPTNFQHYVPANPLYPPPELTKNPQNLLRNHQHTSRFDENFQNLLPNGLVRVKQEPLDPEEQFPVAVSEPLNQPDYSQNLYANVKVEHDYFEYGTSNRRSRSLSRGKLSRLSPTKTRQNSPGRSKSPRNSYRKRSRSPRYYSMRRRSRSPWKTSSTRSRSPRRHSPSRGRSARKYSRSQSRSPRRNQGKYSRSRSVSPRAYPRRSKSPISRNSVHSQNKSSTVEKKNPSDPAKEFQKEKSMWTRTAPADLYYKLELSNSLVVHGTDELQDLCEKFEEQLLKKPEAIRAELPKYEPFPKRKLLSGRKHAHCHSCSSSDDSSSDSDLSDHEDLMKEELEYKKKHPLRLHEELWFNYPGEMNDGPLCRCSAKARRSGIRHNIYAGEQHISSCDPNSNNADKLFHYRVTMSPPTNFLVKLPTMIEYDAHEYIFEGFSMFSHKKLGDLPQCKVIRFNIEYTIVYYEEKFPQNFTVKELNHFQKYLFHELLELVDLDFRAHGDTEGCPQYHFMPRFVRELPGNGKEILSMNEVLKYLLESYQPLVEESSLKDLLSVPQSEWQDFTDKVKGMIVTYPGKKPCSLRVDQLDREPEPKSKEEDSTTSNEIQFPQIVHFGMRPPELSYAGNPEYQKAWREYVKFRHLLANMPKPSFEDKRKLKVKEIRLQNLRTKNELKRNVTVIISSEHFHKTGIMCDVVQHALLLPVLVSHLRFHRSLDVLEEKIGYVFKNRYVLQLALTHPSYRENFGTNPDHARNSLTNCGIRQPVYGDRRIHYMNTRKRGINTLINIMSKFGKTKETESNITHNERLEFLGDAVVEFVTSVHLFHMFSDLEEGGLATYRSAIVQNQHLAVLAKKLGLENFMLYAHGSDLCHDLELRHAMANCFEALMGALFLDGGVEIADKVFGEALFQGQSGLQEVWVDYPSHPLQEQEPLGDRKWIEKFPFLQKLKTFEDSIGVQFTHIRLLARAFTDRSIGYTNLTLGSNQRLEFLGDTVLQLIASEYLYKFFPEHHEGHLSLLRSSLVNNRTQAVVCDDLGMTAYALYSNPKAELKTKDRADLLEAFLGALYVDKDLEYCETFCSVCFFPRLQTFILHQDWNDPKSKLQQCCLTLRTMKGGEPEIPMYKVIESKGPTNTRIYTVAVYFKGKRLAEAAGHSIQQAEMNAAKKALKLSQGLFPQLDHQKRVISKSMNRQTLGNNQLRNSRDKGSRNDANRSGSPNDNHLDQNRRSRTPPLAYRSRNSPETTEQLKKKEKKKSSKQEKKKPGKDSEDSESESKDKKHVQNTSTKEGRNSSDNKQRDEGSTSESPENVPKETSVGDCCGKRTLTDQTSLKIGPEKHCEDHSNVSVSKRSLNSARSRRSRSLSSERSKGSDSQRSNRSQNYSSQNKNIPYSKRNLSESKSRSPARHRSRWSQSRSPNRRYSPERHKRQQVKSKSPSKYVSRNQQSFGQKNSTSPSRYASLGRNNRSPSREDAKNELMDFMLGRRSSLGIETKKKESTPLLNHQPVASYQFQGTSRKTLPNGSSSFQKLPTKMDSFPVQPLNHPQAPNIHIPPPSCDNLPSHINGFPLKNHPPPHLKNLPPFHQGPPPNVHKPPPPNGNFPTSNTAPPPRNPTNLPSYPPTNFSKPPPTKQTSTTSNPNKTPLANNHLTAPPHLSLPPPNIYIPPPMTNMPPPNSRIPPPNSQIPPPNRQIPPHNSRIPPPNSQIPPLNSRIPPQNSNFPSVNSHFPPPNISIPPPNSHIPPPNSHIPPPNSHIPTPNSHIPPPNSHIPPNVHLPPPPFQKSNFASMSSNSPYTQNHFYQP